MKIEKQVNDLRIIELEKELENNPFIPILYWELGLNYLISVGEEKAEEIWSLGLLQCFTSFDEGLLSLVGFIEQHIELNKNDKQTVLILWQQIIKIVPNYLAGHLNLLVVA